MRNALATVNADLGRHVTYKTIVTRFTFQVCLCPPDQIVKNGTKCEKRGQTTENVPMNNGKDPLEGAADDPNAAVGGIVRLVTAKPGQRLFLKIVNKMKQILKLCQR